MMVNAPPQVIAIAALDSNNGIGFGGRIPWKIPEDWQRFRQLTMGYPLVMGRLTYEGLNNTLDGRDIVVVSKNPQYQPTGGASRYPTVKAALDALTSQKKYRKIFIAGGANIYRDALPFCDLLELTLIEHEFNVDTYFPPHEEFSHTVAKKAGHDPHFDLQYVTLTRRHTDRDSSD